MRLLVFIYLVLGLPITLYGQFGSCHDTTLCYSKKHFKSDFEIQIEKKIASASIVSAEQSSQIKDVDGDCTSEIIVSRFIPSKPLISNRILIYDGNLNIKYSILVAFHFTFAQNNFVLLDIDSDGFSEIIIQAADITENPTLQQGHLICYDLNGNIKWIAAEKSILGSNVFF